MPDRTFIYDIYTIQSLMMWFKFYARNYQTLYFIFFNSSSYGLLCLVMTLVTWFGL